MEIFVQHQEYIRQCQECGHKQLARDPQTYKTDSWRDMKCKRCKSMALDYGSWRDKPAKGE